MKIFFLVNVFFMQLVKKNVEQSAADGSDTYARLFFCGHLYFEISLGMKMFFKCQKEVKESGKKCEKHTCSCGMPMVNKINACENCCVICNYRYEDGSFCGAQLDSGAQCCSYHETMKKCGYVNKEGRVCEKKFFFSCGTDSCIEHLCCGCCKRKQINNSSFCVDCSKFCHYRTFGLFLCGEKCKLGVCDKHLCNICGQKQRMSEERCCENCLDKKIDKDLRALSMELD